jgi:hypothetical protein
MDNYLKILKPTTVYSHWTGSNIIKTINYNEIIRYNREKRRKGTNWIEIYLENNQKGYINVSDINYILFQYVKLSDDASIGFSYTAANKHQSFDSLFHFLSNGKKPEVNSGVVLLKRVFSDMKELLYLGYDENLVEVKPIKFFKDEFFYVLPPSKYNPSQFLEIDNFKGKKGLLLQSTIFSSSGNQLIFQISVTLAILTVISIFIFFLFQGWIVFSGILAIIIMLVVIFITTLVLKLITSSIAELYNQIRKRL